MLSKKIIALACLVIALMLLTSCAQSNPHGRMGGQDRPFVMDYQSKFFGDNTVFNQDIAIASLMVMSRQAFYGQGQEVMSEMGFESFWRREVGRELSNDNDQKWTAMAHRIVRHNDEERLIVLVTVPGAYGIEGWLSNLDVGADTPEYYELTGRRHLEWVNRYNHKGFDVSANRIIEEIRGYMRTIDSDAQVVLWITGFSRGGAIASIIGAYFENDPDVISFTYAFGNPTVTTSPTAREYQTIFNILNEDDLPFLILPEQWGFERFGTDISISIHAHGQEAFRGLRGEDYTLRPNHFENMTSIIHELTELIPNREAIYLFDDEVFVEFGEFATRAEAEGEIFNRDRWPRREHRMFGEFYIYELPNSAGYRVLHYQVPAFLFTSLSMLMYAEMRDVRTPSLPYFAEQFAEIPAAFIEAFDLNHPHSFEAYYIIITELLTQALE